MQTPSQDTQKEAPQTTTGEKKEAGGASSRQGVQLKGKSLSDQQAALTPGAQDFDSQQQALSPVQMKGGGGTDAVHAAAARGTQGGGGSLPYLDKIQASFGSHDVTSVQAYTGGAATEASRAMGAEAYATGNKVAFGSSPSLHTAAHEAAHIVQQRAGVSLQGGVGKAGDSYEQHADAAADAVVQGKSAEGILDQMAGSSGKSGVQAKAVQKEEAGGGLAAQLGITQEELEAFARLHGLEKGLAGASAPVSEAAPEAAPVQGKVSHGGSLQSIGNEAQAVGGGAVQLKGSDTAHPVQLRGTPTRADATSITLPTGHVLSGWQSTAARMLLRTQPAGSIVLNAMAIANAGNCTIGMGVGAGGGVAAGAGGGGLAGVGILVAPGNKIGMYGAVGGMAGVLMKLSASIQVTIVKGGVGNFGGPALAVGGSFYAGYGGGVCGLFKPTNGEFLGVTVEGGVGVGWSAYAAISVTGTLGGE